MSSTAVFLVAILYPLNTDSGSPHGEERALDRNRTDDLILTMDVLYRLSYKGVTADAG